MVRRQIEWIRTEVRLRRERRRAQEIDPNFIGFDKYRRDGAYHWREIESNPEYRAKVDLIGARVRAGDRVLDLGCGDGAYVGRLAPSCQEIVGVDADRHAIEAATTMLRDAGIENANCRCSPLGSLAELDLGPFDLVYSMDVIEHLPDPSELARVAGAATRPGGTIIIGTPHFLGEKLQSPYHVKEFVTEELESLLTPLLQIDSLQLLPDLRLDGNRHDDAFIVAICRPAA